MNLPTELPGLEEYKIIQLACGACHVIALDQNGAVLVWGSNANGQLGIGADKKGAIVTPTRISSIYNLPIGKNFFNVHFLLPFH